jgi:YcxB-like protein
MGVVTFGSTQPPPGEAHLTIQYELRKTDLFAVNLAVVFRNRMLMLLMAVLPIPLIWSTLSGPEAKALPVAVQVAMAVLIFLAFLIIYLVFMALLILANISFRKHRGVLGQHTLQITDEGLIERTEFNEALHKWAGMHKIISGRKYLYIYFTEFQAHTVPKRYFTSHGIEGFEGELRKRMTNARAGGK